LEISFFILIGIGIAVYLYRDAESSLIKEAAREASHMNLKAIEYQLEQFDEELKKVGILSKKDKALMDAIYFRRSELLRSKQR
jgi:hypothetical protein